MSPCVSLLLSPITISFCRRKSTRLTAVVGGLVTALGCLFTSFSTQFHQLFFSYGTIVGKVKHLFSVTWFNLTLVSAGVGITMTRDTSTLMVGQYFKKRREIVEIFLVSGSGLGISGMSFFISSVIRYKTNPILIFLIDQLLNYYF